MADLQTIPFGATWDDTYVYDSRGRALGPVADFDMADLSGEAPNDWSWGDVKRQSARNAKEVGANAAAGGLASLAQIGISAIPTSAEKRDATTLAKLESAEKAGTLGLTPDERAQAEATVLNPARALATESRERTGMRLAAAPTSSLATQAAFAQANEKAAQDAAVKGGIAINQANIEAKARQESQIESMETDKANREAGRIDMVTGAIGELAKAGGKIAAAQVGQRGLTDKDIAYASTAKDAEGKPMYPSLYGKSGDEARAIADRQKAYDIRGMQEAAAAAEREERRKKKQAPGAPVPEPDDTLYDLTV